MSRFEESGWSKADYSKEYRDQASYYIPERTTLLGVLVSFYRRFVGVGGQKRVLDLGCGDGVLGEVLLREDPDIDLVVVDGSAEMLAAARLRLANWSVGDYCQATFEDVIEGKARWSNCDLVVSAFAIHHLETFQRKQLFLKVFEMLEHSRYFVNIDVMLPTGSIYEDWYFELWREWIQRREQSLGLPQSFMHVPAQARVRAENHYEVVAQQLADLREAGFIEVECHCRYGLFGLYSAKKT